MAQSWDLLDQLPRTAVDESFTHSTVEIVAQAAEEELSGQQAVQVRRGRLRWLAAAAAVLAAALAGFGVVNWTHPNPNQQLLGDLPVIENVELYRQAGDIEFLHRLNDEGLFPEEPGDAQ